MSETTGDNRLSLAELRREYDNVLPQAERLRRELEAQLARLVEQKQIALGFPIQSRTKAWDSVADKIDRRIVSLAKILDLQDLVGLRLILQFRSQIDTVTRAIGDTLNVVKKYDTSERLKEDQFGYSSIHIVVKLPIEWLAVPTMTGLGDLMAEIQVRTLSQHIWAAASHELQYKQEQAVPPAVRRSIYRVSALLETVDLELDRVLAQRKQYVAQVASDPAGDESILNVDLLEKTLDGLWPAANKKKPENYAELLAELTKAAITTPKGLSQLIQARRSSVLAEESRAVARSRSELEKGEDPMGTSVDRVKEGVYFTHVGLTRNALQAAGLWTPTISNSRLRATKRRKAHKEQEAGE